MAPSETPQFLTLNEVPFEPWIKVQRTALSKINWNISNWRLYHKINPGITARAVSQTEIISIYEFWSFPQKTQSSPGNGCLTLMERKLNGFRMKPGIQIIKFIKRQSLVSFSVLTKTNLTFNYSIKLTEYKKPIFVFEMSSKSFRCFF